MPNRLITYRCGHQMEVFIYAARENRLAYEQAYRRLLCDACHIAREQEQLEKALQQAKEVWNVTDQNGRGIVATLTQGCTCRLTIYEGKKIVYEDEMNLSQVTLILH